MFRKLKSPETSIYSDKSNLDNLMELMLTEQRHQRGDLATIKRQLHTLISDFALQKQVTEYFDRDNRDSSDDKNSEENT